MEGKDNLFARVLGKVEQEEPVSRKRPTYEQVWESTIMGCVILGQGGGKTELTNMLCEYFDLDVNDDDSLIRGKIRFIKWAHKRLAENNRKIVVARG